MKAFSKRETLRESIALTSLMVALNVILNAANAYIPFAGYFLASFLPLVSTIYVLNTKIQYYPFYFISSLALGIATTATDFSSTLLYLVPSLIAGLIYATCVRGKLDPGMAYFYSTISLFIAEVIMIPVINLIYSTDTINNILTIFAVQNLQDIYEFIYGILFLICALKELFVYLITKDELEKLSYKIVTKEYPSLHLSITTVVLALIAYCFSFLRLYSYSFIFLAADIVAGIIVSYKLFKLQKTSISISVFLTLLLSWILYVFFAQITNNYIYTLIVLCIYPVFNALLATVIGLKIIVKNKEESEEKAQ
jgi:hypothetical protein